MNSVEIRQSLADYYKGLDFYLLPRAPMLCPLISTLPYFYLPVQTRQNAKANILRLSHTEHPQREPSEGVRCDMLSMEGKPVPLICSLTKRIQFRFCQEETDAGER